MHIDHIRLTRIDLQKGDTVGDLCEVLGNLQPSDYVYVIEDTIEVGRVVGGE